MSEQTGGFPANPFWDFTIAVYGREGVGPACIALQDRHGLDVNLMIWCCWRAAEGRGVADKATLRRAVDAVTPWREAVTEPLRRARRSIHETAPEGISEAAEALRRKVLSAEIDSERVAQLVIARADAGEAAGGGKAGLADAAANLRGYLALSRVTADDDDRANLVTLLAAAFPDAERAEIERLLA